jgi:U2 small nuclear ribonucleoprotein A'
MSLSANLISRSPAFLSPLKDRELDLRGNKIAVIENLAATQDQFDSIDLSDNEIRKLECMAILKRLTQLLLNNNRITRISEGLGKALPKLETLVLTNNRLSTLAELEPLAHLPTITSLALVDNPVSKLKDYRAFVIALLPRLKVLDYKRVKLAEREEAEGTFRRSRRAKRGDGDEVLAAEQTGGAPRAAPTEEQIAQIRQAILTASSLEEVQKLESALARGDYSVLSKMAPAEDKGAAEG